MSYALQPIKCKRHKKPTVWSISAPLPPLVSCAGKPQLGICAGSSRSSLWAVSAMPEREGWDMSLWRLQHRTLPLDTWSVLCRLFTEVTIPVITAHQGCFLPCFWSVLYKTPYGVSPLPSALYFHFSLNIKVFHADSNTYGKSNV